MANPGAAQRGRLLGAFSGSAARGRETTWGPVDGGSARDLRAAALTANPARQLTGLCATAHRPTRSRAGFLGRFLSRERREKREKKFTHRSTRAGVSPVSGVGRAPWSTVPAVTRCPSPVAGRSRVLRTLAAAVDRFGGADALADHHQLRRRSRPVRDSRVSTRTAPRRQSAGSEAVVTRVARTCEETPPDASHAVSRSRSCSRGLRTIVLASARRQRRQRRARPVRAEAPTAEGACSAFASHHPYRRVTSLRRPQQAARVQGGDGIGTAKRSLRRPRPRPTFGVTVRNSTRSRSPNPTLPRSRTHRATEPPPPPRQVQWKHRGEAGPSSLPEHGLRAASRTRATASAASGLRRERPPRSHL